MQQPLRIVGGMKLLAELGSILSDHELLVGGDHVDLDLGVVSRDQAFLAAADLVPFGIQLNAHEAQIGANILTGQGTVLANTCGEDQAVQAVHGCGVGADILGNLVAELTQSQDASLVALCLAVFQITEVGGMIVGQSQNTGLLVQHIQSLVNADAFLVHDILNNASIDVTGTGSHGNTCQRRQTHGGIYALTVLHSGQGGTVAQMADDDLALSRIAEELDGTLGNETVGGAVEAVTTEAVLLIILGGDGITVCLGGHGHVESCIKDGDLGLTGHNLLTGFDAHEVCRIMEGAQRDAVTDGLLASLINDAGCNKLHAAVENTVTDGVDLVSGLYNTQFGIDQNCHNSLNGLCVGGHGKLTDFLNVTVRNLVGQSAVDADTLANTLCEYIAALGIHELILQGRAACVNNENFHDFVISCKNVFAFLDNLMIGCIYHHSLYYCITLLKFYKSISGKRGNFVKNIGIVCEYNPFHNGHAKQLQAVRQQGRAVCLMSGSYVQRGEPAIVDKYTRAKAAVLCGADLVLELPLPYAISSAEGFADGAVEIFSRLGCMDGLCFGSESGTAQSLMDGAALLLSEKLQEGLREELKKGVSFPKARQLAAEALGMEKGLLDKPNNILAIEYCKALLRRNSTMEPIVLHRGGNYHGGQEQAEPSASFLRSIEDWEGYVPHEAWQLFQAAPRYTVEAGERAWLCALRFLEEGDFETLPYGSEGLWRKVMEACRTQGSLAEILEHAKSKRYPMARLKRMLLCALLGMTEEMQKEPVPYARVLAMNSRGQELMRQLRKRSDLLLLHPGEEAPKCSYAALERRAEDLYGLFRVGQVDRAGMYQKARLFRETGSTNITR